MKRIPVHFAYSIHRHNFVDDPGRMAQLTVAVQNVPVQRYRRRAAKTKLDAVVAVGGVVGLFFGASALSVAQLVYIWCLRRRMG